MHHACDKMHTWRDEMQKQPPCQEAVWLAIFVSV